MATITASTTTDEVLHEIGRRLRAYRIQRNVTQAAIAEQCGISVATVKTTEGGRDARLSTVIELLRALGRLEALEAFLPPPGISPMALLERRGAPRQRARPKARDDG